jgi:hypothetical protein
MATTPTYSWPIPDDTDLVKDGAEAIRDLGNAIDTTVGGLSGAGLVHIETRTVSAVAAENFNDVFTSDYNNYKIFGVATISVSGGFFFKLRASGSDESSGNYNRQSSSFSTSGSFSQQASQTSYSLGGFSTNKTAFEMTLYEPNLNLPTGFALYRTVDYNAATSAEILTALQAGGYSQNYVADGFTFLVGSGTFSGTFSIYGIRK